VGISPSDTTNGREKKMMMKWEIPTRVIWRAVLLLIRDAHGRFTRLRYPKPRPTTRAVQLALF
jgi:hypothetical protein